MTDYRIRGVTIMDVILALVATLFIAATAGLGVAVLSLKVEDWIEHLRSQ